MNVVVLIGNLTRDPELRYTNNQTAVCNFGLAVNKRWTDANGQPKESVCFVDCTVWAHQAETVNRYLDKGSQVAVQGELTLQQWEAQDGSKRQRHIVTVRSVKFLGSPSGSSQGGQQDQGAYGANQGAFGQQQPSQAVSDQRQTSSSHDSPWQTPPMDDDIPF